MRPKILFGMIILPTLIVAVAVFWKIKGGSPIKPEQPGSGNIASSPAPVMNDNRNAGTDKTTFPPMPPLPAVTAPAPKALTDEEKENLVYAERANLTRAYSNPDSNSPAMILADLTNSEPQIRAAAVEAAKQLGDPGLIPALTNLAATVEDYDDRHALLAAADFLALPTLADSESDLQSTPTSTLRPKQSSQTPSAGRPRHTGARQRNATAPVAQPSGVQPDPSGAVPNN